MKLSKITAYAAIFMMAFMPVLYLLILKNSSVDFSNFSSSMRSFGKILGLSGIVLFSLTFFLNTRLKSFEKIFGGMDKAYRIHHNLGTFAFLLVLFHPIFLSLQFFAFSIKAAAEFFYSFNNFPVSLGIFALLSMTLFLLLTFFSVLKYQNWKFTHRLLGISFILASLHILLIPSDVSGNYFLRAYMIVFILIGLGSYSYRTLFWKFLVKRQDYKIKSVKLLGSINEIRLEPKNSPLEFRPGQFVFVSFNSKITTKEPHPFTISSSCHKKEIIFSIKKLGDFTGKLKELREGIDAKLEGPYGKFSFVDYPSEDYLFIAGGIGITPFLSMARSISDAPEEYSFKSIDLYYSVKKEKEAVFLKELENISKNLPKNKKLNIFLHVSDKKGHIDSKYILGNSKTLNDRNIFICGPPAMMESLKKQFILSGVKKNKIKTEEFALL